MKKFLRDTRLLKESCGILSYKEKRDFLRILGVCVYVYRRDKRTDEVRYEIRLELPEIKALVAPYAGAKEKNLLWGTD